MTGDLILRLWILPYNAGVLTSSFALAEASSLSRSAQFIFFLNVDTISTNITTIIPTLPKFSCLSWLSIYYINNQNTFCKTHTGVLLVKCTPWCLLDSLFSCKDIKIFTTSPHNAILLRSLLHQISHQSLNNILPKFKQAPNFIISFCMYF